MVEKSIWEEKYMGGKVEEGVTPVETRPSF